MAEAPALPPLSEGNGGSFGGVAAAEPIEGDSDVLPTSTAKYRYTKEQMYAIAASPASQIKPPRLPSIVCRDDPGNLANHKEVERERTRDRKADKLGAPPGLAPPADKRTRERTNKTKEKDTWKDRPADSDELESLRPTGTKQFPSSQLGKGVPLQDPKAKGAARPADPRARNERGPGAREKQPREDPRLRNRKDRETFGDVSSPTGDASSLDFLSASSARDPEEMSRFAALSKSEGASSAAPEPFALVAGATSDAAVPLTDMFMMEKMSSSVPASSPAVESAPGSGGGDDSRFGRWFDNPRDSASSSRSSLLAAVQTTSHSQEPAFSSAPSPPVSLPVDSAIISFASAPMASAQASTSQASSSSFNTSANAAAPPPSSSSAPASQARKAATPSSSSSSSISSSTSSSASPSSSALQAPVPAPMAAHAPQSAHTAPAPLSAGYPSAFPPLPQHAPQQHLHQNHHQQQQHQNHHQLQQQQQHAQALLRSSGEEQVAFPPPRVPPPAATGDGSSFPLPQISALAPNTFTSNALLSLLRQGEQQQQQQQRTLPKGSAKSGEQQQQQPMGYYGPPPHMQQMMPPPYGHAQAPQMQAHPPPHLAHMGRPPPQHTPLPPPAGFAPPNYPPTAKSSGAQPGMLKAPPGPYMPYNQPPPGKLPPSGFAQEAYYPYPPQVAQQPPPPGQQRDGLPPMMTPGLPQHHHPAQQRPPQGYAPAGAGLERWFGPITGAAGAPPRPVAVPMKSLDEIESQLARSDGRP